MPPLTLAEREIFLQTPGVLCRIATVDSEGAPHVTPIWYLYEEDAVFFTPRAQSAWLTHLRADPRVALTIDEEAAPYRKVTARGTARLVHDLGDDDLWRDRYRRIAERYVSPDGAAHYIETTIDQPRALFALDLATADVGTWRMPLPGEPYSGIWHRRYYAEGSRLAPGSEGHQR